jgi:orotate phosphoribosyltransferase
VVLATFSYGFDEATSKFADADLKWATLTDFDTLLRVAERVGALASSDLGTLQDWHRDPAGWSENYSMNG